MFWYLLGVVFVLLVLFLYWRSVKNYDYWNKRGVKTVPPWPFVGNFKSFSQLTSAIDDVMEMYSYFPDEKYCGVFLNTTPALLVKDPELIKKVGVKDFEHFHDHAQISIREDIDPLLAKNLLSLAGQRWKDMRSTISPTFTSSKMKLMFELVSECGQQLANHFKTEMRLHTEEIMDVEMKDTYTRFANDVISTCAFGIQCNSLKDPNNEFYRMGKDMTNFKTWKMFAFAFVPTIMKLLGIGMLSNAVNKFFRNLISETVRMREEKGIIRPDMIHLLMQAQKGQFHEDTTTIDAGFAVTEESAITSGKKEKFVLTNDDIVAQAMIFFLAGFETTSTMLSFTTHELALNPEVQQKLQSEIDETLEKCDGKLTYEALFEMEYLDMVVCESLRKWPPGIQTERLCTKTYKLETETSSVIIEKGVSILMPMYGLHRDPKYFEYPEKFDPERFNKENKQNIKPFTYLPFGTGPRNCVGSRFALMEAKVSLFYLLANFDFVVTQKTDTKSEISNNPSSLRLKKGFWVGFKFRK